MTVAQILAVSIFVVMFVLMVLDKIEKQYITLVAGALTLILVFDAYKVKFEDAISNDLNTSMAITIIYDLLKDDMNDKTKLALINDFDKVLSLNLTTAQADAKEEIDAELESYVLAKIEERKEAKKAKDFAKADAIRDELLAKGIVLKDTREGVIWHKA